MAEEITVDKEVQKDLDRVRRLRDWDLVLLKSIAEKHGKPSLYWVRLALHESVHDYDESVNKIPDILCLMIALSIIKNPRKQSELQRVINIIAQDIRDKQYKEKLKDRVSNPEKYTPPLTDSHISLMPTSEIISMNAEDELRGLERGFESMKQMHARFQEESSAYFGYISKYGNKPDGTTGCFVATATYGSPNHETVVLLRQFRDKVLANYRIGRLFIGAYWIVGPRLAWFINCYPSTKKVIVPMLEAVARCVTKSNREK